jgi:very-short-patch-repair endonuclease
MSFTKSQINRIIRLYEQEGWSIQLIADEYNTYKNKIRRALLSQGVSLRSHSEAQKLEEEKIRISDSMATFWEDISEEELERRSRMAKEQWANMTEEQREALMKASNEAIRLASVEGSKLEKSLEKGLTNAGFVVEYHREGLIPNKRLQIDMFVPEVATAIEIDGPSHFLPIWKDEAALQKTIKADLEKSGLLIQSGFVVIRVKHMHKNVSAKLMRDVNTRVIEALEKIRKRKPPKTQRIINIEV